VCPVIEPNPSGGDVVITDPGIIPVLQPSSVTLRIGTMVPPGIPMPCEALVSQGTTLKPIGDFALIATAARPIPIDVRPAQGDNVLLPGSAGHVAVAILAARPLDLCPIDERSLRLGDGDAEPIHWSGREQTRRRDVDGDGAPDLLARFRVRDTGIAFGDDSICLVAQTTCGELLEGCDAIQTLKRL